MEDKRRRHAVSAWWAAGGAALTAALLLLAAAAERRLPEPRTHPPDGFHAHTAHAHLTALAALGPRVSGSYENEVAAVGVVVRALRAIAAGAAPHNRLEVDVHRASGAFPLSFLDGMNHVYRDVQSVVARVSAVGGGGRARTALLLNCHLDSVPDSPGASDDAAGCAVALETLRALLAAPRPLRHDVIALFNGAEENVLQASHAFVTHHKWAGSVRAFINIEACGAGGREVLFQAGPHDPWLVEVYAGAVPHPFASSLAQELFESGLIPADTDFRIFRDFGGLSGVDLAWNTDGYVYHTRLDTAGRVPPAALQRTGDNVLALVRGLLDSEYLESEVERTSRQPVFFDVLGVLVVSARAPLALAVAAATLALVALRIHLNACDAARTLYIGRGAWWRLAGGGAVALAAAHGAGAAAAALPALALHVAGARLLFYSRVWLLAPLYALPAVCGTWAALRALDGAVRRAGVGAGAGAGALPLVRHWWAARLCGDALAGCAGAALAASAARGLRSGFVPLTWALPAAVADVSASLLRCGPRRRAALWVAAAALPAAQCCYLALASLNMLVPVMGRAGTPPAPPDVIMALLVGALALMTLNWVLPFVVAAQNINKMMCALCAVSAATLAWCALSPAGAAYSAERPQRVMVFHTRRADTTAASPRTDHFFWIPHIDANTPHTLRGHVAGVERARATSAAECARWVFCGAPYYLPVRSLIAAGHSLPARTAPAAAPALHLALSQRALNATTRALHVHLNGSSHNVVVVSPAEGVRVAWSSAVPEPLEGARWGRRRTYFFALHDAQRPRPWHLELHLQHEAGAAPPRWAAVSAAAHTLFGEHKLSAEHRALLAALPPHTAPTGWAVDMQLADI